MMRNLTAAAGLFCLLVAMGNPAPLAGQEPEAILYNGKIVTVDADFRTAQAVAIRDGKILAVGSDADIRKLAGGSTKQTDLQGRTVIPGLADNHLHSAGGGPGVDLSRVETINELLAAIQARVLASNPGDLILSNSDWHEAQLKEQRLPLRRDLDTVSPENPVVVVRGGHTYILNSMALRKWEINENTPIPDGGAISRYEDGTLNGELIDTAKSYVKLPAPPEKTMEERIQDQVAEYRKLHAAGLTSVRHPGGPVEQYRMLEEMKKRGLLTMRVSFLVRMGRGGSPADIDKLVASWNLKSEEGDEWLRVGGIKLGVDGGFEGGLMTQPYEEPYGKSGQYKGLQTTTEDAHTTVVKELSRLGWRVATHAVGDAAIQQVLNAYEAADQVKPIAGRRWAIEHGFLPRLDQMPLINKLGVLISAQDHLYLAGPSLVKYWGRQRANWVTPMRMYLDHLQNKMAVSGGTDAPVIPYPPLWAIYHFVTRNTMTGGVLGDDQRISREEALRVMTINNAYLTFEEKVKGSIEPGKFADLVVLSDDIMTCPEERLRDMSVLATMVGGKVVYQSDAFRF